MAAMEPLGKLKPVGAATILTDGYKEGGLSNRLASGLRTPNPPRFSTWVYTIVVLTSRCPSSSCTVRMSCPPSSRCVANECRRV